jgi:hypothetical protein
MEMRISRSIDTGTQDYEKQLSMESERESRRKKEKEKRVSIEEGKEREKRIWENRKKGREISKVGNDLNNRLQLWDDNPLWVVKNPKYVVTRCFHPLGYGVRLRIFKLIKIKICTMRMKKS